MSFTSGILVRKFTSKMKPSSKKAEQRDQTKTKDEEKKSRAVMTCDRCVKHQSQTQMNARTEFQEDGKKKK